MVNITRSLKFKKPTRKRSYAPLLPDDLALIRQMDKERASKSTGTRLQNLGPDQLPWMGDNLEQDVLLIIKSILLRMWEEIPKSGVHHTVVTELLNFRKYLPGFVCMSQLYGVFPQSNTFIDRIVHQSCQEGSVRLLRVNVPDASDILVATEELYTGMDSELVCILEEHKAATCLSVMDFDTHNIKTETINSYVQKGWLSVDAGRPNFYFPRHPRQGAYLKLVTECRTWLLKTLTSANKWKELPEPQIEDKLHSSKHYWRHFKGVTLEWILYDAVGSGWIEAFKTPIGRGWQVLRTK